MTQELHQPPPLGRGVSCNVTQSSPCDTPAHLLEENDVGRVGVEFSQGQEGPVLGVEVVEGDVGVEELLGVVRRGIPVGQDVVRGETKAWCLGERQR